jgi:hypothetical protein
MQTSAAPIQALITLKQLSEMTPYSIDHLRRLAQHGELGHVVRRGPRTKVYLHRADALARLGIQAAEGAAHVG